MKWLKPSSGAVVGLLLFGVCGYAICNRQPSAEVAAPIAVASAPAWDGGKLPAAPGVNSIPNANTEQRVRAVAAFIDAMKEAGAWKKFIGAASATSGDTLIVTMLPGYETQPHRQRLVFAKLLATAWERFDNRPGARPSIRLEDTRGHEIGGSTMLGDVEVDDD